MKDLIFFQPQIKQMPQMFLLKNLRNSKKQIPNSKRDMHYLTSHISHLTSYFADIEHRIPVLICFLLFFISSCTQNSVCLEPQALSMRGGFYVKDTANNNQDTLLVNANLRFGSTFGYFNNLRNSGKFAFPLSQTQDTVALIFQSDSSSTAANTIDTFQLIYSRELRFISVACGYQTQFTLQKALTTNHVIDSVLIAIPDITNDSKEHLKIIVKK